MKGNLSYKNNADLISKHNFIFMEWGRFIIFWASVCTAENPVLAENLLITKSSLLDYWTCIKTAGWPNFPLMRSFNVFLIISSHGIYWSIGVEKKVLRLRLMSELSHTFPIKLNAFPLMSASQAKTLYLFYYLLSKGLLYDSG